MKVSNLLFKNASGSMAGFTAGGGHGDVTYLRGMPKKGNQGKDAAHKPAQNRAATVGEVSKKGKAVFKTSFPEVKRPLSSLNRFQQINMTKATGSVSDMGYIVYPDFVVAEGSISKSGLLVNSAELNGADPNQLDIDLTWNSNANGANVSLYAIVISQDAYEMKAYDLGIPQTGNATVSTIDVTGYADPVVYVFWRNDATNEASGSEYLFHV